MSFMKINNHIVNLEQIAYVINIEENRKLLDYNFKTGLRLTQSFATEEEAKDCVK